MSSATYVKYTIIVLVSCTYTIITMGHYFDLRTRSLIWLSRAILSLPWNCGKMEWKRVVYLVKYSRPLHFFNNFMAVVTSFCPTLCWLSKLEIVWSKPVWTVVTVCYICFLGTVDQSGARSIKWDLHFCVAYINSNYS